MKVNDQEYNVMHRRMQNRASTTKYEFLFYGHGWMDLVGAYNMAQGFKVVFTNLFNNRASVNIFKKDCTPLTHEVVRRTLVARGDPYPGVDKGHCL